MRPSAPPSAHAIAVRPPGVDAVGDRWRARSAVDDALELVCERQRGPHAALEIDRDAVGRAVETLGEDPAVRQVTVLVDGVGGEPAGRRLRDDQGFAVGRDRHAVGEVQTLGDHADRFDGVVGVDPHDDAATAGLGSDVGASALVEHHVAQRCRGHLVQVGKQFHRFAVVAQHLPLLGGHDVQGPIGAKTQAGRRMSGQRQRGHGSAQGDGVHGLAEHVREPQQALEPPRPLTEAEPGGEFGRPFGSGFRRHGDVPLQNTP